jgi:uncharacterized protein involved in response to NO
MVFADVLARRAPPGDDRSVPRARVNAGDRSIDRRGRQQNAAAFLSYGFRPFFLLGSLYAALAVPLWLCIYLGRLAPIGSFPPLAWHAHEMLFGYLAAITAGFVLTAVPNWTGRLPLSGTRLAVLVGLWLVGRAAMAVDPDPVSTAILDLLFPMALAGAIWREILAGRNVGNAPIAVLFTVFATANLLDHAGRVLPALDGYGVRLGLGVAAMLIALVGGRVTPSFTRNWLSRLGVSPLPAPFDRLDRLALLTAASALTIWVLVPLAAVAGAALVAAGALLAVRLARWRGYRSLGEPIVLILHLGYFWLAASLALIGLAALLPDAIPASSGIHALTAGAIGTMTLGVMTRATRGHTGRTIAADRATIAIYALVTIGALLRVLAPFAASAVFMPVLVAGGIAWTAAFLIFAIAYGPMLMRRRADAIGSKSPA